MKILIKPFLVIVLFEVMQFLSGMAVYLYTSLTNPQIVAANEESLNEAVSMPTVMVALLISSAITILLTIWPLKMFVPRTDLKPSGIGLKLSLIAILGAIAGAIGMNVLSEYLDLPDLMEDDMDEMIESTIGCLVICFLGPITEEVAYRGAIMGHLLRNGMKPWHAIIISAVIFGVIHMNPAQIPFAMVIGLLLGIVYYKTGNILLTSLIHILNNSISVLLSKCYGTDYTITQLCDGNIILMLLVSSAACILLMRYFWNNSNSPIYNKV